MAQQTDITGQGKVVDSTVAELLTQLIMEVRALKFAVCAMANLNTDDFEATNYSDAAMPRGIVSGN